MNTLMRVQYTVTTDKVKDEIVETGEYRHYERTYVLVVNELSKEERNKIKEAFIPNYDGYLEDWEIQKSLAYDIKTPQQAVEAIVFELENRTIFD